MSDVEDHHTDLDRADAPQVALDQLQSLGCEPTQVLTRQDDRIVVTDGLDQTGLEIGHILPEDDPVLIRSVGGLDRCGVGVHTAGTGRRGSRGLAVAIASADRD
jgi:hypothetical protein